jgi:competence protein ComEA
MQRQHVSEWFVSSKKQRNGSLILLSVILLAVLFRYLAAYVIKPVRYDHSKFEKEIAALKIKAADSTKTYRKKFDDNEDAYQPYNHAYENKYNAKQEWKGELFYFDPNTLDEAGWQKLGVRDKTIATIKNYLSKGGKFYQPEDIKKIWGIDEKVADKMIPYIQIEKKEYVNNYHERPAYEKKTYTPSTVDINVADTTAFIALPGIGSKLAQRIITFRDKLGGFYKIEQVGETFGLADSTFQKIKPRLILSNVSIKHIDINTATIDELKTHPYIRYVIGNAIIQYRTQHGRFSSVNDVKKIMTITEDIFNKMLPYLKAD